MKLIFKLKHGLLHLSIPHNSSYALIMVCQAYDLAIICSSEKSLRNESFVFNPY